MSKGKDRGRREDPIQLVSLSFSKTTHSKAKIQERFVRNTVLQEALQAMHKGII